MPADSPNESTSIAVGLDNDHLIYCELSSRIRGRCPFLGALPSGAILPNVHPLPFSPVLCYLRGDASLSVFKAHLNDPGLLLIFAQTWALGARLGLPQLQNELISAMSVIYAERLKETRTPRRMFPADAYLALAIQHLRSQFGYKSQAESFLVCFVGRNAPLINELERELSCGKFEPDVRKSILAEARSFEPDPIDNNSRMFRVSTLDASRYLPLEVQRLSRNRRPGRHGGRSSSSTVSSITVDEEEGRNSSPPSDITFSPSIFRYPSERFRSPKPVHPPPRNSPPNWLDSHSGRNIRIQPGDPDDPDPCFLSQQQDFVGPRPPDIDHDSFFNRDSITKGPLIPVGQHPDTYRLCLALLPHPTTAAKLRTSSKLCRTTRTTTTMTIAFTMAITKLHLHRLEMLKKRAVVRGEQ